MFNIPIQIKKFKYTPKTFNYQKLNEFLCHRHIISFFNVMVGVQLKYDSHNLHNIIS